MAGPWLPRRDSEAVNSRNSFIMIDVSFALLTSALALTLLPLREGVPLVFGKPTLLTTGLLSLIAAKHALWCWQRISFQDGRDVAVRKRGANGL